jgi:hypothetical protein
MLSSVNAEGYHADEARRGGGFDVATPQLGQLKRADVRTIWQHEAAGFTLWPASPEGLEMLQSAVVQHQNRAITSAQVIEELIELAEETREAKDRGEQLGLTEDEVAFYDALETNDSAVAVLGDETLKQAEAICEEWAT